ncbi:MAG: hypothetical protein AMJ90_03880 [candidate division Zixibacteria bacterium SM23_73_2]|nr:MAG: hypothetical protein AMJ90_03880 [candidate division Zixibacteria bacterium SM23_73_2]
MHPNRWVRILWKISGTFFVGLAILGIFLPLLPTTPFLLLALACYAKSSKRLHSWLLTNRWFGRYLRNYRERKGIPFKVKILTVLFLWLTIGYSAIFIIKIFLIKIILFIIAAGVSIHILSIPTLRKSQRNNSI